MPGIETHYRNAVGSQLTYPTRLGAIRSAIDTDGCEFTVRVRFWSYKPARPGEIRYRHPIFEVRYHPGFPEERDLQVSAIPKSVYLRIQERVPDLLSKRVGPWLVAKHGTGWDKRIHALRIWFNATADSFEIDEEDRA